MPPETSVTESAAREPYEKPAVSVIELFAAEVLAIGCKMGSTSAPGGQCSLGSCAMEGS